jgi:hypothetical protein
MFKNRFAALMLTVLGTSAAAFAQEDRQVAEPVATEKLTSETQSATEASKAAANPLASAWLLQWQQNNNWIGTPRSGTQVQSNLQFQPLLSMKLTDDWKLVMRPVLSAFSTSPYQTPNGYVQRMTGFGDTSFAMAISPGERLAGNWLLAAGPTFIFPTATESILGQNKWQFGPTAAVGYQGKHFITYVFPQQWFSIGGDGRKTNQMSTQYAFSYFFSNGWSVGTNPNIFVDWQAPSGQRVAFPVGFQVGKLRKVGPMPVKIDLQVQYYPVHPDAYGPKWNIQLQITPILPALIKRALL